MASPTPHAEKRRPAASISSVLAQVDLPFFFQLAFLNRTPFRNSTRGVTGDFLAGCRFRSTRPSPIVMASPLSSLRLPLDPRYFPQAALILNRLFFPCFPSNAGHSSGRCRETFRQTLGNLHQVLTAATFIPTLAESP